MRGEYQKIILDDSRQENFSQSWFRPLNEIGSHPIKLCEKIMIVDITPIKCEPYKPSSDDNIEKFLSEVKINEYVLPWIGQKGGETSIVEIDGVQIAAAWMRTGNSVLLRSILVVETGKGIGTKYLKECLECADKFNVRIFVEPWTPKNKKWYMSLGFKPMKGTKKLVYGIG